MSRSSIRPPGTTTRERSDRTEQQGARRLRGTTCGGNRDSGDRVAVPPRKNSRSIDRYLAGPASNQLGRSKDGARHTGFFDIDRRNLESLRNASRKKFRRLDYDARYGGRFQCRMRCLWPDYRNSNSPFRARLLSGVAERVVGACAAADRWSTVLLQQKMGGCPPRSNHSGSPREKPASVRNGFVHRHHRLRNSGIDCSQMLRRFATQREVGITCR